MENWYYYLNDVIMNNVKMDIIQLMSVSVAQRPFENHKREPCGLWCIQMFDAGGSYLSFPSWVPFGRYTSRIIGIVVGRWLGGALRYQPYYRK